MLIDLSIFKIYKAAGKPGLLALIYPVIYFIFSRRRDPSAYSAVDFTAFIFIIYSIICFVVSYNSIYRKFSDFGKNIILKSPIIWFFVYSVLGILSMMWSVNYTLTGYRAFECISMGLLFVAIMQNLFKDGCMDIVIKWSLLFCTWNIIWSIIRMSVWAPDITTLMTASQFVATTFFYLAIYCAPRVWYKALIIIMSIFSMSTVAYIGMALGLVSGFWGNQRVKKLSIMFGLILVLMIVAIGPYEFAKNTIFFDKKEISIHETSGRDNLLNATLETLEEHPFGLGFFSAEPYVIYGKGLYGVIGAHSSIFSASMGMGFLGIITILMFFLFMGKATFSNEIPTKYRSAFIGCFCVAFMHCMGNPSVGTRVFGAWMPCMYIFILISAFYVYGRYYELEEIEE